MKVVLITMPAPQRPVCMVSRQRYRVRDDGFMYVLNEIRAPSSTSRLREAVASCPNGASPLRSNP